MEKHIFVSVYFLTFMTFLKLYNLYILTLQKKAPPPLIYILPKEKESFFFFFLIYIFKYVQAYIADSYHPAFLRTSQQLNKTYTNLYLVLYLHNKLGV